MSKTNILIVCIVISAYVAGFLTAYKKPLSEVKKEIVVAKMDVKNTTVTSVAYVPKKDKTDFDVSVNVGKQLLKISVNGVEQTINKEETEAYVLEKNKLQLTQQSKTTIDIKAQIVDKTRHYNLGVGYSNHGISAMAKAALPFVSFLDAFAYVDSVTISGGLAVSF